MKGGPGVCHLCITPTVLAGVLPQFRPSPWRGGHSEVGGITIVSFWRCSSVCGLTQKPAGPAGGRARRAVAAFGGEGGWYTTSAVPPVWPSSHNK